MPDRLTSITAGMAIPYGGDKVTYVPDELAGAFSAGDRLIVVQDTGALLHIPKDVWEIASDAAAY